MKLVFLGQQSWLFSSISTNILIDPILTESFGSSENQRFWIYPNRKIDRSSIPKINAILISSEHIQHFHLKSLLLLDRSIKVFIGFNTPYFVEQILTKYGFSVSRLEIGITQEIGEFAFTFFAGKEETIDVDARTHSILISETTIRKSVILQSDTTLSQQIINASQKDMYLEAIICTNNCKLGKDGKMIMLENILPIKTSYISGMPGLELLFEIVVKNVEHFSPTVNLVLNGSGYTTRKDRQPIFKWTQRELVNIASKLTFSNHIYGPCPGECFSFDDKEHFKIDDNVSWISQLKDFDLKLLSEVNYDENSLMPYSIFQYNNYTNDLTYNALLIAIEMELKCMSKTLILSELGADMIAIDEYLSGKLSEKRFSFQLINPNGEDLHFVFDISQVGFRKVTNVNHEAIKTYPFGMVIHLSDFIALLAGKIQAWELATAGAIKQWHVNHVHRSPIMYFLRHFAEDLKPDLAFLTYENSLSDGTL